MLLASSRPTGTLLWIGPRHAASFADAYQYCDHHVAQLAYRKDLPAALKRPCSDVRAILWCCENDTAAHRTALDSLTKMYPAADSYLLVGPMVAGQRPSPSEIYRFPSIEWHAWESVLPAKLAACGVAATTSRFPNSIVVVAESLSNRSALMSIAASGTPSAIACSVRQLSAIANVDEFWWDDSATQGNSWSELMDRTGPGDANHVWISADVSTVSKRVAIDAGVGLVISKPGDFSPLIDRVMGITSANSISDQRQKAA